MLKRLVSEQVSLRNMRAILDGLVQWGHNEKDTVLLTEYVRGALKRQICFQHCAGTNLLPAYILTPDVEDTVRKAIRQTSAGSYLTLDPLTTQQIVGRIKDAAGVLESLPYKPVLLTSIDIRRYIRKLIEFELYELPVLSYQELTPDISVQPLARIALQ
ncbi:FHIPEP family type III secretion protein [Bradyrhizobium elkanii]|uniref:FHIPEP family type III secretion protein n=1 Tax=Bradyrhizobium elkanii TaxID=29448 RepID=UPI0023EA4FBE|nr:FHIPEP family type III secretion protein [Bradyrhizobium elkanii]